MAEYQCCENPPGLSSSSGVGQVKQLGGLTCYISGSVDSKSSVILISDIFGYEAPNLRKIADKVAAAGFFTVVPDFLKGDPFAYENADRPFPVWLKDHEPNQGFEHAKPVIQALKDDGIKTIGAAGFCWGAKVVVELAKHALIQSGVLLHPSFVSVEDIQEVKVPISILGAEIDRMSPPELVKEFETALNAKPEIECSVKIFSGVSHGWSVRYEDADEHAVKSASEAHTDLLDWFLKHLK